MLDVGEQVLGLGALPDAVQHPPGHEERHGIHEVAEQVEDGALPAREALVAAAFDVGAEAGTSANGTNEGKEKSVLAASSVV